MKKADLLHRGLAKLIDFLIVGMFSYAGGIVGVVAGALYILISDGFFSGQSVGKKLIGLKTAVRDAEGNLSRRSEFRDSMVRNSFFAVLVVLAAIPLLGFIFTIIGVVIVGVETYFVYTDDQGIRLGDIFAGTQVIDDASRSA